MPRFKNALAFRIESSWTPDFNAVQQQLDGLRFVPCAASQESSAGWVPPRSAGTPEGHGPLLESVGGQWLLEYMIESKTLPASVVRRKVDERCAQIEAQTGRAPGKKEKKQLKEDTVQALLPLAFTRHSRVAVWIDPRARRLTLDSANTSRADAVVTALVQALAGFAVAAFHTQVAPAAAMAGWLATQEAPAGFSIDRECELRATDDSKAVVRYAKHPLNIDEVGAHIESGKRPTRLAMTWEDRVAFELTEGMQLRKLQFLEGVFDDAGSSTKTAQPEDEGFDTDAAIVTGELGQLLPALMEALGGEMAMGQPAAAPLGQAGVRTQAETETEGAPF